MYLQTKLITKLTSTLTKENKATGESNFAKSLAHAALVIKVATASAQMTPKESEERPSGDAKQLGRCEIAYTYRRRSPKIVYVPCMCVCK